LKLRSALGMLSLLMFIGESRALGAAMPYTINFTPLFGTLPTSGSFDYDSSTSTFTNFSVVSDGFSFDLTGVANSPLIVGTVPCLGGATGGAATFALMTTPCAPQTPNWLFYDASEISVGFRFATGSDPDYRIDTGSVTDYIKIDVGAPQVYSAAFPHFAQGEFTTSGSVPEPGSILLTLAGLGFVVRRRIANRSHSRRPPLR
jgi:hypothetical protein